MSEVVWKAVPGGRVRHALRTDTRYLTKDGHEGHAVCGASPIWYAPEGWLIRDDFRECLKCRRWLNAQSIRRPRTLTGEDL